MAIKDLYSEKKKEKNLYSTYNAAAPRTQNVPQSDSVQRPKREKSPSELGEEAVWSMLKTDAAERQRQAAAGSAVQHGSDAAGAKTAGNRKTAQYGDAAIQFGEPVSYSSLSAVKPTVGNQKATPYGGAAAAQYNRPAAAKPAIQQHEKTPSERGVEVVRAMLEDDGLLEPPEPEGNEAPAGRAFTTGVGRSDIIGPAAYAARNAAPGDGLSVGTGNAGEANDPTQTMPDWLSLLSMPDYYDPELAAAEQKAGLWLGQRLKQLCDDTHIAEGMSMPLYWIDRGVNGGEQFLEGIWNYGIDSVEAVTDFALEQRKQQAQQRANRSGPYQDRVNSMLEQIQLAQENLPEVFEFFRSHEAAKHLQEIEDMYDAGGLIKIGGDTVSGLVQIGAAGAISALTGNTGGLIALGASAAGNADTEARAGGADDKTAYMYGNLVGLIQIGTELWFGGIPGLPKGLLDNALANVPKTNMGRLAMKAAQDAIGEGWEEFVSTMAEAYLAKIWNGDERGAWQTFEETFPDALYAAFQGATTSMIMNAPSNISNIQYARALDAAIDVINNGGTVTEAKSAAANAALQYLTNSWGKDSKWSRDAAWQWEGARNRNFDHFFSPIYGDMTQSSAMQNNAMGNNVPTDGANSNAEQNTNLQTDEGAKNESSQETQSANNSAAHVGKNTIIQNPYTSGPVPQEKTNAVYDNVPISDIALQTAAEQIQEARTQGEKGFKKYLKTFYREAIGNLLNGKQVTVENILFEDRPYKVTLNTNVIEKVISDPNMSAEKLAVFSEIEDIVKNAQYLGSGEYIAHGARAKQVIRYDYFEAQVTIGGNEYTVSFDVEVYPDRNNYRTHRVINNLELMPKN